MSIVIGKKSTNQIAQYMLENKRGFLTLFTNGQHGFWITVKRTLKADLHGTTLSHATSLRQAYDMNCFV